MSTIKANAYLDASGGNTATINGIAPIAIAAVGGSSGSVALSGTSVTFTGIPAGVKKVQVVIAAAVSGSTGRKLVRVGAGSLLTSGYISAGAFLGSTANGASATNGFTTEGTLGAGYSGTATLTLESGNKWVYHHDFVYQDGGAQDIGSGYISVGGTLDRVSLTTANGSTFTAGTAIAYWEFA